MEEEILLRATKLLEPRHYAAFGASSELGHVQLPVRSPYKTASSGQQTIKLFGL